MGVGQCGTFACVAALQAIRAQKASHTVMCVVYICVTLKIFCVYINTGLNPGHMAILGCPTKVFREGGDWDVTGQFMRFHCAHLMDGEERKHFN